MHTLTPAKACLVCGTPLSFPQSRTRLLCGNAICAWKFDSVPARQRCAVCGRALTVDQLASQACADPACRHAWLVDRPIALRRERIEAIALGVRNRAAAALGIANAHSFPLTLVPHNNAPSRKLPARRKRRLREHLARVLNLAISQREAVAKGTAEPRPDLPPLVPPAKELAHVMLQACIGCRGFCCRTGGEHAYITQDTMQAYLEAHPDESPDAIIETYLAHVPERTLDGGCVFQHANGCALPREMRGDLCNRYYCGSLVDFQSARHADLPPKAFFVPTQNQRLGHPVFAAPESGRVVRHRTTR